MNMVGRNAVKDTCETFAAVNSTDIDDADLVEKSCLQEACIDVSFADNADAT